MIDPGHVVEDYLSSWNAAPEARSEALSAWTAEGTYVDSLMSAQGGDAIGSMIDRVVTRFPGHRFEWLGAPDGHGPFIRFG